jgi:hypothetical protein
MTGAGEFTPLLVKLEPPKEMVEAVTRAVAEKPWLRKH